ncbi:MAG: protein MraZ [Candidatus Cloacimonetes bacterium]|nr:protein MraZ [Candidatus Cloacimonadota bacterium]
MSGEFLGTYQIAVNKGKWITLPAALKKKFSPDTRQTVIITLGPKDTIAIFPLDVWHDKISRLKTGSEKDIKLLVHLRSFAGGEQKLEANGRVKISDELIKIMHIDDRVIIKGEGNFISIWKPELYEKSRAEMLQEHRQLFDSLDYQK